MKSDIAAPMDLRRVSSVFLGIVLAAFFSAPRTGAAQGTASGTLSIDGVAITLKYAYAMAQPNTFDKAKTDIAILLTEKPLADGALDGLEELEHAVRKQHGWVFFKIDDEGKPVHEVVDHPATGGNRLMMSGFTHAQFAAKTTDKARVAGTFATKKIEDFLSHKYQLAADFSAPIVPARRPEPLPDAKSGKALPPDGGEPGKAYRAYVKAMKDRDLKTLRSIAPAPDQEISDAELLEMLEFMTALTPADVSIRAAFIKGDRAALYLEGVLEGERQYATVELARKSGVWKIVKERWSNRPPEK